MLNIYQWFYKNIWPLKDKEILVNYKDGKILVKAPIWTWKSFLFFDGPIYALYKTSERTIINKDSKKWEIQLLFSQDDNFYLIIRKITLTKTWKDSTKSEFYSIVKDKNFIDYLNNINNNEIIEKNNDILTLLKFYQIKLENLTTEFKQERELQENLNSLLIPKEVALSTTFLPQNSDNIFEMEPSSRINILKKVFGIMGIDDAKKIIDDKKKEITWEIKWRENTENYKTRFWEIIWKIKKINEKVQENELNNYLEENIFWEEDFELDIDKIQKLDFDINRIFDENKKNIENLLSKNEEYKQLKQNIENITKQLEQLENQKKIIEKEINSTEQIKKDLGSKNKEFKEIEKNKREEEEKILKITQKYENLQQEYEKYLILENKLKQIEEEKEKNNKELTNLQETQKKLEQEIKNNVQATQTSNLSQKLKELQKEADSLANLDFSFYTFEDKKVNSLKELEKLLDEIKINGKNTRQQLEKEKETQDNLLKEKENLEKQIKQSEKKVDFMCEKINSNCPFISQISQKLNWKDDYFTNQLKKVNSDLEKIQKNIKEYQVKLTYLKNYWIEKEINQVLENIQKYEQLQVEIIKLNKELQQNQAMQENLAKLNWQLEQIKKEIEKRTKQQEETQKNIEKIAKEIEENKQIKEAYKQYLEYNENINNFTKKLNLTSQEIQTIQDKLSSTNKLSWKLEEINKQIEELTAKQTEYEKILEENRKNIEAMDIEKLKNKEKAFMEMKELFWIFNALVEDFNKNKLELIELKKKFWLLKELSNIFGKELVIYVFADYISSLESLINYFITDLVDFKLNIHLDEKGENLEIFAEDELWKREIKSLSWGQKTALRIGWILWISKLQNSKLLFLDETINNFDQESVQIISKKIKEFTEENQMKFYMITHSEILQQSDIWTEVIELSL